MANEQPLRAWRGDATQAQAAEALGVSLRTYQGWEAGRHVSKSTKALLSIAIAHVRPR